MNLELAIVQSCHGAGCLVRLVGQKTVLETHYSDAVRDRIRIRRGDLVAVDTTTETPQLVWRWRRGEILQPLGVEPAPGRVLVGAQGCAFDVQVMHPGLHLEPGDVVWFAGNAQGKEIVDRAAHGEPQHADRIRRTTFPLIEDAYATMDANG
jgi:hypothetical protein